MTQTDNSSSESNSWSLPSRFAWIALILATLYICYFHNLDAIGLVGPDEPRYAWIARDMVETGDCVTPRLYGKPWFEKPVLYYWGAALSFKLFGVNEAAARFPSAASAFLATLAMAWLAWRFYGAETARWLLLLLPTTVGMIGFSHAAATDMPFSAMLTIAMVCAAVILGLVHDEHTPILPQTPWLALVLFGFFLALAALAKGPAAIVLSGGAVLLWAIFTKRWRDALRCLHPVGIASFCLTALPWYVACARRNPDFFRVFIIEHNVKRYLTPEFQHFQPFWFYVPIVLIAFVPWTLVLIWSAAYGSIRSWLEPRLSAANIFLLSWAAFCLLFFSVSKSKLPGYILPAIPSIGLLLARSYVVLVPLEKKYFRWLLSASSILSLVAAMALFWIGRRSPGSRANAMAMIVIGCVLLLFALANLLLMLEKRPQSRLLDPARLCVLPVFVPLLLFPTMSKPWLHDDLSGKTLATEILARQIPCDRIYAAAMPRGKQFSLSFYLHHQVQDWSEDAPKDGYLLLPNRNCSQYVKPPWVCGNEFVELKSSGWFLYPVRRAESMGGLSGLSGLSGLGRRSDDSVRNGQPR